MPAPVLFSESASAGPSLRIPEKVVTPETGAMVNVAAAQVGSNAGAFSGAIPDRYYYRSATKLFWYNVANGNTGSETLSQEFTPADFAWSNGYFWGMNFNSSALNSPSRNGA